MAFVLDENLTTKWYDAQTVIPDAGDNVWFIVGDKIHVGIFCSETKEFVKADKSHVGLDKVRQWSPLEGEKHITGFPEENQIVAAKLVDLPCFVTGLFSSELGQHNLGQDGPGLLLDQEYNLFEMGINNPVPWESVFEWYALPLEPLLLLPVIVGDVIPLTVSELIGGKPTDEVTEPTEEVEQTQKPQQQQQVKSAIVASKNRNNILEKNEDKPMSNKLQEAKVSYELTKYNYQPWGQAKEAWQYILDNDKFDEFDQLLEEWYPEGIDETTLNDILAYEPETVYPHIGLRDPYNTDVTEDDFDGYTELTTVNDIVLCDVNEDGEFADILEYFAKDMGLSEEDAKKVLIDKGYIKNDQLIIPAGKVCTVKDVHYDYELETTDFPFSFDLYQPDTSDFKLNESVKKSEDRLNEGFGPDNPGHKIIKYHGFYIEKNFYGKGEFTVHYCGDDVWFYSLKAAKEFIDDIHDTESCFDAQKKDGKLTEASKKSRLKMFVKRWYLRAYPDDEMGQDLDPHVTFEDILVCLSCGKDFYDCIGAYDSVIREHIFNELAARMGVNYDKVYKMWLGEAKKKAGKRLKEDYGWECDPDDAWNLLDEMKEVFGADYLLDSIARAMSNWDLAENLAFICRNEDFRSQYLNNLEDEEDDEDYEEEEESQKPSDNKLQESGDNDGWSDEVELIFDEVMADSANFAYEIQHCRRGVYTGATTPEVLAQAAYRIADKWNEAGEACETVGK